MGKTWKVILAFIGIFLAGAVAGGFVSLRFVKVPPPQVLRQTVTEQQWVIGQMRRFVNELKLDDAQRERVKPTVDRAATDIHAGGPRTRHLDVVAESDQRDGGHGEQGIGELRGNDEQNGGPGGA